MPLASDLIMTSEEVPIHQIVCIDEAGGIGKNGDLPWKIQKDWQHFLQHSLRILDTSKPKVCWILGKTMSFRFLLTLEGTIPCVWAIDN